MSAPANGTDKLLFYLNGSRIELQNSDVQPELTLLEFIRSRGVTGCKLGCAEGGCGACTVSVARWDPEANTSRHEAVNACLFPVCAADGLAVFTVDGIGSSRNPHPAQEQISQCHGSQCGFCTPGIVMALFARLQTSDALAEGDIDAAMDGNLCRCTGYRPILDAARKFADAEPGTGKLDEASFPEELRAYVASKQRKVLGQRPARREDGPVQAVWHRPTTLEEICKLKAEFGADAKLVAGNTEVGVDAKFRKMKFPTLVFTKGVDELSRISVEEPSASGTGGVTVGGAVTLSNLKAALESEINGARPSHQSRTLQAVSEMLKWFASTQIRNTATLAGNIVTASPISDTCHILVAIGATADLAKFDTVTKTVVHRTVALADFFKGYRKVDCAADETVVSIRLPFAAEDEFFGSYKQGQRREDDIAICGAGLRIKLDKSSGVVQDCTFMFSGMAPLVKKAEAAEAFCRGKKLVDLTTSESRKKLGAIARDDDFNLPAGVPGGRPEFRMTLAASFLFKFFISVREQSGVGVDATESSAGHNLLHHAGSTAEQQHSSVLKGGIVTTLGDSPEAALSLKGELPPQAAAKDTLRGPVGQPIMHRSALLQCTGEALYNDDVAARKKNTTLQAALVLTDRAVACITAVDASAALTMEGVKAWVDESDIPEGGSNIAGEVIQDETIFMPKNKPIDCVGRFVGVIVAETRQQALAAAAAVKVTYSEPKEKGIYSISDAIAADSFHGTPLKIVAGDSDGVWKAAETDDDIVVVEGEVRIGGQEHFYLETQGTCAIPGEEENNEMHIISSTQAPKGTQEAIHRILGIPFHKVTVQASVRLPGARRRFPAVHSFFLCVTSHRVSLCCR